MKRQTRQFLLKAATGVAIVATAAAIMMPTVASAAPATATAFVNVREQPVNGRVVNTLERGEQVDVQECQGSWCYVIASGQDGWVSASYLTGVKPQAGVQFGFTIPGGPTVQFGFGDPPPPTRPTPRPPPPVFDDGEACFYESTRYRGGNFCVAVGDEIPDLGGWAEDISSIENPDGFDVTVCTRTRYRGTCRTYTSSARTLGTFDDAIVSLRVD
jgi:uncharacterized protein YraI